MRESKSTAHSDTERFLVVICPTEKQERLYAAGQMLYLSPYEPQAAKLTKKEMYIRAHALVDWALAHSNEHLEAWPE